MTFAAGRGAEGHRAEENAAELPRCAGLERMVLEDRVEPELEEAAAATSSAGACWRAEERRLAGEIPA